PSRDYFRQPFSYKRHYTCRDRRQEGVSAGHGSRRAARPLIILSLGGTVSKTTLRHSILFVVCAALTVSAMSSRAGHLRAASSPPPTVGITRVTALNQNVWPGDFNGDGITDLASSSAITYSGGVPTGGNVQVSLGKGDGT